MKTVRTLKINKMYIFFNSFVDVLHYPMMYILHSSVIANVQSLISKTLIFKFTIQEDLIKEEVCEVQ